MMMTLALAAPPQGAEGGQSPFSFFFLTIILILLFYVMVFGPERKRKKKLQEMIDNLKNGDQVVTTGGIYGTVAGIEERTIHLRVADQVKVKVSKSAIVGMVGDGDPASG